jgi:hypothetical protein
MKSHPQTEVNDRRPHFIGGSDARIVMGQDEKVVIRPWQEKRGEVGPAPMRVCGYGSWSTSSIPGRSTEGPSSERCRIRAAHGTSAPSSDVTMPRYGNRRLRRYSCLAQPAAARRSFRPPKKLRLRSHGPGFMNGTMILHRTTSFPQSSCKLVLIRNRLVGACYGIQSVGQKGTTTWRLEYPLRTSQW